MHLFNILLKIPLVGKKICRRITEFDGGEKESKILRRYTKEKYGVDVAQYSYGDCFNPTFNLGGKVTIGSYCSFASNIHYYGANHPTHKATTSPYFYNKSFGLEVKDVDRHHLYIGNDVWIGYGVIITCGCHKIGNGAVIGAGSVVTKDVPDYTIYAGVPAKEIKKRFDIQTIESLEKSEWWTYSPKTLYQYYDLIDNPRVWAEAIISDLNRRKESYKMYQSKTE